jgi:thymidylate synthase (FAD)
MAEHGHNSVLEMGSITLNITCPSEDQIQELFLAQPRYLHIDRTGEKNLLITASIRAYRELLIFHPNCSIAKAIAAFISQEHPYFFTNLLDEGAQSDQDVIIRQLSLGEIEQLMPQQLGKHRHLAVKFITNRAVTHEIVRHRPCSFLQESQRYCRYSDDKFGSEVTFIKPLFFEEGSPEYILWQRATEESERLYLKLLETSSPQAARTVLPNSCKTELIVFANLTQWRHIFSLRTTKAAEPSMRELMIPLAEELAARFPATIN